MLKSLEKKPSTGDRAGGTKQELGIMRGYANDLLIKVNVN